MAIATNVMKSLEEAQGRTTYGKVGTFLCSPPTAKVLTTGASRSNSAVWRYRECRILASGKLRSRTLEASVRRCVRGRAGRSGGNCPCSVLESDGKPCEGREARFTEGAARGLDSARAPSDRRERPRAAHEGRPEGGPGRQCGAVRSRWRAVSCYCAKQWSESLCVAGRSAKTGDSV
jgi:hypothetical protein